MNSDEISQFLDTIPDDVLSQISFSVPWQYDSGNLQDDPDRMSGSATTNSSSPSIETLQTECWNKFQKNPQISTAIRGLTGRIVGFGFEVTSEVQRIQEAIEEIFFDQRNRLFNFLYKYVARSYVEGELFLCLTLHPDGFVEVDYIEPSNLRSGGDGSSGIIFHPYKTLMPLLYLIDPGLKETGFAGAYAEDYEWQIPSIFLAYYPELIEVLQKNTYYNYDLTKHARNPSPKFRKLNGFNRFIVAWDKSFITRRAVSYIRTTIEWLNYYEDMKKYEIDHKKSSGSYLWVFTFEDVSKYKFWLSLSDEDKRKTGIATKASPGSRLILPPGMKLECINPTLSQIKEQDTDILEMVASGLNEPSDIMTGTSKGTFASVKATRGPMSERTSDEIALFERFFKYDFWAAIFYLKSQVSDFPEYFKVREAVEFKKGKPKFSYVKKRPEQLIDISFPISEIADLEGRTKGLLGVKHAAVSDTLGIPNKEVAVRLGFGGYGKARLRKATEEEQYPQTLTSLNAEAFQESTGGELPVNKKVKNKPDGEDQDTDDEEQDTDEGED